MEIGFIQEAARIRKDDKIIFKMTKIAVLEKIDWDFVEAATNTATNAFHPYPAKFIPPIPKHFIEQLSEPGTWFTNPS
jgi:hypothetical protein